MRKVKDWFIDKYVEFMFWWNRLKLERQLDRELRPYSTGTIYEIYQDDTQRKYAEGMAVVKHKINTMVNTKNKSEYERVLKDVKELIALAREETPSQRELRKILTSLCRLPEKSKKQMIDERIQHYVELQEYNKERALIKEIKQAKKEGNLELANELEEKWRLEYGKVRNPRRR